MIANTDARAFAQELLKAFVNDDDIGVKAYALGVPNLADRHVVAAQAFAIASRALWEISDTTHETPAEIIDRLGDK